MPSMWTGTEKILKSQLYPLEQKKYCALEQKKYHEANYVHWNRKNTIKPIMCTRTEKHNIKPIMCAGTEKIL